MDKFSKEEQQEILNKKVAEINETINAMAVELDGISNKLLRFDGAVDLFQEDSRLILKVLARISNSFCRGELTRKL
jgi:hypothetical protein